MGVRQQVGIAFGCRLDTERLTECIGVYDEALPGKEIPYEYKCGDIGVLELTWWCEPGALPAVTAAYWIPWSPPDNGSGVRDWYGVTEPTPMSADQIVQAEVAIRTWLDDIGYGEHPPIGFFAWGDSC